MVDLDYFKYINDCYGYFFGDEVICYVVNLLCGNICSSDSVVCLGGEEFFLFLFDIVEQQVCSFVEKFCECFEGILLVMQDGVFCLIVSFGVVSFDGGGQVSYEQFYSVVDQVFYWVKSSGCNWVEVICLVSFVESLW